MRMSAIGGIIFAIAGIALGLYLDGGRISQMVQPTAALIVFGGTLGAIVIQFPFSIVLKALGQLRYVFFDRQDPAEALLEQFIRYTLITRRGGLLALDNELASLEDPFLRKSLTLAIDGTSPVLLRAIMEIDLDNAAEFDSLLPRVFESAGGFAPTIGILGAVIGLIQVMQRLENINEVGKGIAVAFVATIYGVGSANLFFLPCAGRIKIILQRRSLLREMMLEGVLEIVARSNPRTLQTKLSTYLNTPVRKRQASILVSPHETT